MLIMGLDGFREGIDRLPGFINRGLRFRDIPFDGRKRRVVRFDLGFYVRLFTFKPFFFQADDFMLLAGVL